MSPKLEESSPPLPEFGDTGLFDPWFFRDPVAVQHIESLPGGTKFPASVGFKLEKIAMEIGEWKPKYAKLTLEIVDH